MSNLYDLEDYREGEYLFCALAMCVALRFPHEPGDELCLHRWVAGVPKDTSLFMLECPRCHAHNSFASILPSEYLHEFGVDR